MQLCILPSTFKLNMSIFIKLNSLLHTQVTDFRFFNYMKSVSDTFINLNECKVVKMCNPCAAACIHYCTVELK